MTRRNPHQDIIADYRHQNANCLRWERTRAEFEGEPA